MTILPAPAQRVVITALGGLDLAAPGVVVSAGDHRAGNDFSDIGPARGQGSCRNLTMRIG